MNAASGLDPRCSLKWYSVLSAAQRVDDPTVSLSHLQGRAAALTIPWITEGWLDRLEKQFAHGFCGSG